MLSRKRALMGATAVAVGLVAWEYARVEAHSRLAPDTKPVAPDAIPGQSDTPQAPQAVRVTSPLPGAVSAVYVAVGAFVKMGQALALIDSPALRARLDAAKADLEMEESAEVNAETAAENLQAQLSNALSYKLDLEAQVLGANASQADARSILEHRDQLYKAGVLALQERDLAERNYDTTEGAAAAAQARLNEVSQLIDDAKRREDAASSKVEQAKADLQRCELAVAEAEAASGQRWVIAPIDGRVTVVDAQVGQSVESGLRGSVLFEIVPTH